MLGVNFKGGERRKKKRIENNSSDNPPSITQHMLPMEE